MTPAVLTESLQWHWIEDPDTLLHSLQQHTQWHSEYLTLFGKRIKVPRQVAWQGDAGCSYRYSGVDHVASGWSPVLSALRDQLSSHYQQPFNFVLLNHYRSGADYMGWHADDEPELVGDVCSVSLGATRRLLLQLPDGSREGFDLPHGSALRIPRHWRHSLARTRRPVAARINLSFRCVR